MDKVKHKDTHKTFRNLFTMVASYKRERVKKGMADMEIREAEDKAWGEWEELNKRTKGIYKKTTLPVFALIFLSVLFFGSTAGAWTLGGNYNRSDPNFNTLAMRVYNSNNPYIFTQGAYTYNAIPITASASGCKIVSVIRRTQGFPNPRYWAIENYKICSGNIVEVKNTNMAGWNNLPQGIKPVINNTIQEARQYGKATAIITDTG